MFAERSSRKMPQWWWVHRSLFQPTSWPGFKMPWDFPWPPAWWLEGAWAHMYRPGYARIIIYIFYVGIPNKTTNPSVHMYIYIYTHQKTHILTIVFSKQNSQNTYIHTSSIIWGWFPSHSPSFQWHPESRKTSHPSPRNCCFLHQLNLVLLHLGSNWRNEEVMWPYYYDGDLVWSY